jgi:hypothetical protein
VTLADRLRGLAEDIEIGHWHVDDPLPGETESAVHWLRQSADELEGKTT